jgi:hypothetical protein
MAVAREAPICPRCGAPYEAIHRNMGPSFVGDTFIMWDSERHVCKQDEGSPLSRYEERLERILDTLRALPTLEGIVMLKNYIPKEPYEE